MVRMWKLLKGNLFFNFTILSFLEEISKYIYTPNCTYFSANGGIFMIEYRTLPQNYENKVISLGELSPNIKRKGFVCEKRKLQR